LGLRKHQSPLAVVHHVVDDAVGGLDAPRRHVDERVVVYALAARQSQGCKEGVWAVGFRV